MLPAGNVGVSVIKILFTANLICSYPITVNPTNTIIESYLFTAENGTVVNGQRLKTRYEFIASRVSRFCVVFAAAILGIVLASDMDKFLGLAGALLGSPIAMTLPALIHLKLIAKSNWDKLLDFIIIVLSGFCLGFSTVLSLESWVRPSSPASPAQQTPP